MSGVIVAILALMVAQALAIRTFVVHELIALVKKTALTRFSIDVFRKVVSAIVPSRTATSSAHQAALDLARIEGRVTTLKVHIFGFARGPESCFSGAVSLDSCRFLFETPW